MKISKVAIVILNWNGKAFLERFVPHLIKNTKGVGIDFYIADNASGDGSMEFVRENFPLVKMIQFDRNWGFAEGYNRALSRITAEYFILLNSDVMVSPGWLDPLNRMMDSDPLIAACMPKIRAFDMPDFFEYAGAAGGYIDKNGFPFCRGRIFDSLETDYGQYDAPASIFWASGACLMIRSPLFKLIGGLDPHFFAHFEEIDLCWRLKNRGYKIMAVPESVVFHVGGGALPKTNSMKTFLNFRNSLLTLYKNLPEEILFRTIMRRLILDGFSVMRFLAQFKFRDVIAIIKAHFYFYRSYKGYKSFRRNELKFITRREHEEIYPGSIVKDYFLRKKYTFNSLNYSAGRKISRFSN